MLIGSVALRPVGGVGVIGALVRLLDLVAYNSTVPALDQVKAFIGNPQSPELVEMPLSW